MHAHSRIGFVALLLCLAAISEARAARWEVTSPNQQLHLSVQLGRPPISSSYPRDERLYFQIEHGGEQEATVIIPGSPLGLLLDSEDFLDGLKFESAQGPTRVEESYLMPHGKRHRCSNVGNALTLRFLNRNRKPLELDLRVYDDGAAFRYRLPGQPGIVHALREESTGFRLRPDMHLWMAPYDRVGEYTPAYETYYENGIRVGVSSPTDAGWALPALFCTGDELHWALVTEANLGTNYFGAHLSSPTTSGLYRIQLPDLASGHGYGGAEPVANLPWEMPWRVVLVGDSPGAIVESTLVNDLSAASKLPNTDWVKPGRVAWSWWSDQESPRDASKQKRFIDFAAEMGWEYLLVDANWTIMQNGNVQEVLRYAKEKGVGVLLWYNSGGPNNIVTEKPRDSLFYPEVRRFELKLLKDWGVKGIKVDFFQSDKPDVIALYQSILRDAAEFQIMINFHGCTVPRGWDRTYPHLMSMEAVRGEECYLFESDYPTRAPVQNTILPFTRNAIGPMDYTPMGLSNAKYPHKTTYAHELALPALFESGWVHFADDPDAYRQLPEEPKKFIKELPVAWDDTRFVSGYPGKFVVLARRHGDVWYLAGVNGQDSALSQKLDLKRIIGTNSCEMTIIGDGADDQHFKTENRRITADEPIPVTFRPYGGFVAKLSPVVR